MYDIYKSKKNKCRIYITTTTTTSDRQNTTKNMNADLSHRL